MHTNSAYMIPVHDPNSLLMDRLEDYFQLSVNLLDKHSSQPVNQIHNNLFANIQENTPFNEEDEVNQVLYWNIIVNFMNQTDSMITEQEITSLEKIKYRYCKDLYYEIPILLYILKTYISSLQQDDTEEVENAAVDYMEKCFSIGQ